MSLLVDRKGDLHMLTYNFWRSEVGLFETIFADGTASEQIHTDALKALCYIAIHTLKKQPDLRDPLAEEFQACLSIAKDRRGIPWVRSVIKAAVIHEGSLPM